MHTILVIFQVLVGVALVGLILLQHGKGADAGAAFGSGASGTVFGSRGTANFLSRATAWLATAFFAASLALAYLVHDRKESGSVVDAMQKPVVEQPAAPAVPPAAEEAPKAPIVPE
ncbi:MAG TPA: preprotein translocase subunit SecG [Solimonas sp.]|nr:preprotein translocase subunit SecG [Solimonas sp.]